MPGQSSRWLLMLCALELGCAATGTNSPEGWNRIRTKNFTMYSAVSQRHNAALEHLELHRAALTSSFFRTAKLDENIEVLFLEDDDFRDLMGHTRESAALAKAPGGGSIGKQGLLIVRPGSR